MKRKLKLVSSIVSLMLAFAFMTVGVIAAVSRQATVGGSISFQAERLDATITVKYKNPSSTAHPSTPAIANYTVAPANGTNSVAGVITFSSANTVTSGTIPISNFAFTETNKYAGFYVEISVPTGARGVKITFADMTGSFTNYATLDSSKSTGTLGSGNVLAAGSSYVKYYNFSVVSDTKGLADTPANISYSLGITLERQTA